MGALTMHVPRAAVWMAWVAGCLILLPGADALRASESLVIRQPPVITQQPNSLKIPTNSSTAFFSVTATGTPPLQYQWRHNGDNIPGATSSTLIIVPVSLSDAGLYSVRVSNPVGSVLSSNAVLCLDAPTVPPPSDDFAGAPGIAGPDGLLSGNNSMATSEKDEPLHAGLSGGKSVWYQWRATGTGVLTIHTMGSAFDTLLAVYRGTQLDRLMTVTSDDDSGGHFTSRVRLNVQQNNVYYIAIDGLGGASGEFLLGWTLLITTQTIPMIQTQPASLAAAPGSNAVFQVKGDVPALGYQWFFNNQVIRGATGATYTVQNAKVADIGVYTVLLENTKTFFTLSTPAYLELADPPETVFQDKFNYLIPPPTNTLDLAEGVEAFLMDPDLSLDLDQSLDGVGGGGALPRSVGFISINYGASNLQQGNNSAATTDVEEPNHCGAPIFNTLWLGLIPKSNGMCHVTLANTPEANSILSHLAVYEWTSFFATLGDPIACDITSAPDGLLSHVQFPVLKNKFYVALLDGYQGATGNLIMVSTLGNAPPITAPTQCVLLEPGETLDLDIAPGWAPVPSYQWQVDGIDIPGATSAALTIENFQADLGGLYSVVVSNAFNLVNHPVANVFAGGPFRLNIERVTPQLLSIHGVAADDFILETADLPTGPWGPAGASYGACEPFEFLYVIPAGEPARYFRGRLMNP